MLESDIKKILETLKEDSTHTANFSEQWSQGRSAFGGIAAAFATTAMRKMLGSPQQIRSLMVSFIAPLPPGKFTVDPQIIRQGRNVTQTSANVLSNGNICLQALAAFGNSREGLLVPADKNFNPTPREKGISFESQAKRMPSFLKFFEGSWVDGGRPFAGKLNRKLNMWVKHRADLSHFSTEEIVTLADIPPPVILTHFDAPPVPSASLSWSLEFVEAPESIETEWFYLEFTLESAANGYTQQSGKIFDENGRLCALTRQCMVYFT